jgi:hypothetical protein
MEQLEANLLLLQTLLWSGRLCLSAGCRLKRCIAAQVALHASAASKQEQAQVQHPTHLYLFIKTTLVLHTIRA